jgi:small GTP-binding protein
MMLRIEGILMGDEEIGKTCLLYGLINRPAPHEHIPTILEAHTMDLQLESSGKDHIELVLYDTPGRHDHLHIVHTLMKNKDFILLCFSLVIPASFNNINKHWMKEIKENMASAVPIVLIGLQLDLRNNPQIVEDLVDKGTSAIDYDMGRELADEIGAVGYIECSNNDINDIEKVREKLREVSHSQQMKNKKNKCSIS